MTDPAQDHRRERLAGIGLMLLTVMVFACLDATAKYLGNRMPVLQVVGVRCAMAFLVGFLVSNPFTRPGMLKSHKPLLQLWRACMLLGSTVFNFMAFRWLQLDEAMAILFSAPFLIAIFAGPLLGEWIGWRRWCAIMVGFAGVLVVIRPGSGGMQWAALLSFCSAICYAFYNITTRMLARSDSSETTLFYGNLFGCLVMTPVLPFVWATPPTWLDVALMLATGILGSGGHFLLILAHRRAPASVLSPFIYTQIIWASLMGYLVFGNVPNHWTVTGACIVVGSGLYLLARERKVTGGVVAPVDPG